MTPSPRLIPNRRGFLAAAGASVFAVPGLLAADPVRTPAQTEGPFYPDKLPLDTDNDLLVLNDGSTPAVGDITHLTGKILDAKGNPLAGAVVEIWQCDANGVYLHTADSKGKKDKQDKNFQGFGRFTTDKTGAYYFRTIKPVPYPGRCPHIHFKVKKDKKDLLVTQMYVAGDERNAKDGIYMGVKDKKQRESITVEFAKMKDSKTGELSAHFEIVLGYTPKVD
ncbi:MAG: protocatechuate 3,4-dioxygenase [Fimbriiglobus sp.]|nr:protocatechuate 3,4-dioxygenase [Fimbriiglobus sp.]